MTNNNSSMSDLKDAAKDLQKLQPETIIMDLPEVKDIPGQENVKVPQFREMQDTTISSSDEEGDGLLDDLNAEDDNDDADVTADDSNVTKLERQLLSKSTRQRSSDESQAIQDMALDSTDDDGEVLNEQSLKNDNFGEDLDVPGADLDDADENVGEEDEENNMYSQSQKDN